MALVQYDNYLLLCYIKCGPKIFNMLNIAQNYLNAFWPFIAEAGGGIIYTLLVITLGCPGPLPQVLQI